MSGELTYCPGDCCGTCCGVPPPWGVPPWPPCGTAPGGVVDVFVLGFGAFLHSWMTKPLRQFVWSFHFFWKSLTNELSDFCWPWEASSCLTVGRACCSVCWLGGVTLVTLKT